MKEFRLSCLRAMVILLMVLVMGSMPSHPDCCVFYNDVGGGDHGHAIHGVVIIMLVS